MNAGQVFRNLMSSIALAVVATACGSDPGGGPGGDNPSIAISLSVNALSVQQGGTGSLTASISRNGGFTGTVTIQTEGAPNGVTASASNVTTSGTTTTGTVNINVAGSVDPGTYNLTVRASGSGVSAVTAAFTLTVTAAPAVGITLAPAALSVSAGQNGTVQVTINRTNFAGNVTLALEGAPTGVTGTFAPNATATNASTLTVAVGGAVEARTYNLTVRAIGAGVTDATAALALTVSTPSSYTIQTIAPDPLSVAQGASGAVTVTLARTNFTAAVGLAVENLPTGVTGTFAPASVTGTTSTLTLQVANNAAAATTTEITVRGTATGQPDQTKKFSLTVTAVQQGSYALSTTAVPPINVIQNDIPRNIAINIARTNFTGQVDFSVTGAPVGMTTTFTPTGTTGNSVTLAVSATTGVTPMVYPLVVKGTATGLADQTLDLNITVQAASGGGSQVSLNYAACDIDDRPAFVAYQDGPTANWTAVTGANNTYTFAVSNARVGLALVIDPAGAGSSVLVSYFEKSELVAFGTGPRCPTLPTTKSVTGTVANLTPGFSAFVSLAFGAGSAAVSGPVTINGVENGTYDLLAYARQLLGGGAGDRIFVRRDVNTTGIAPGGSLGAPIDMTGSESFAPAVAAITIGNPVGGEQYTHGMFYNTQGSSCTSGTLYAGVLPAAGATFNAYGMPNAQRRSSDRHGLFVTALNGTTSTRTLLSYFESLSPTTVTLAAEIAAFTPSVLTGPYKRLRFQFGLPASADEIVTVQYLHTGTATNAVITATSLYISSSTADLSFPDLSGLAGWNNAWMPPSGQTVDWTASASSASGLASPCASGSLRTSTRLGTI